MRLAARRIVGYWLLSVAAVTVAATAFAAVDSDQYVYARYLDGLFLPIAAAAATFVLAAHLLVRDAEWRRVIYIWLAVMLFVAACLGSLSSLFPQPTEEYVAASSKDFKVVVYRAEVPMEPDVMVLRLRINRWLFSRDGLADLACFMSPESGAGPGRLLDKVHFVAYDEIAVSAKNGDTWRIELDVKSLSAMRTIDRCAYRPD